MTTANIPESPADIPEAKIIVTEQSASLSLSTRLTSLLHNWRLSPDSIMLVSAFFIGGGAGIAMVVFHFLIDLFEQLTFDKLLGHISVWGHWTLAFIPILGGLIVGCMRCFCPEILGNGFSALLSNVRIPKITLWRPIAKMLAAAVSLGTGASLGPEGPSVEIGANIGILLGQTFQVSQERFRLLLGAGAAAGLSAGFNAPIAGVFFALEVVLGTTFTTPAISLLLLSAVFSAVISHLFFHANPAFELPDYQLLSHWEWLFYLGLGLLASLVSLVYTQSIKLLQSCFQGEITGFNWLSKLPRFTYPAIGGLCVGVVAIGAPHVLGVGYGTLQVILQGGNFPVSFLGFLLVAKLILTAISLGSGFVGGVFAPALFLGACLGAIYGNVLSTIIPTDLIQIGAPPAYAMVGMAAVLAGSVRAPLTAILLLFELTHNYSILLPLMAAVGVSVWIVEQVKSKQVVKGLDLQQMGLNLQKANERELLNEISIANSIERSFLSLPGSSSLIEAGDRMIEEKCHTALVLDENEQLMGVISLADIQRQLLKALTEFSTNNETIDFDNKDISQKLQDVCTKEILYVSEDESVTQALERMAIRGLHLLPVVTADSSRQVLGVVEKHRINLAGEIAITQELLHRYCTLTTPDRARSKLTTPQKILFG
jgi:H+/Cl- antiporter ClcA/CBS domain-containing protein